MKILYEGSPTLFLPQLNYVPYMKITSFDMWGLPLLELNSTPVASAASEWS